MAPTLAATPVELDSGASSNTTALVTASFTPAVGEVIVVKRLTPDVSQTYSSAPSGGGLTFTTWATVATSTRCWADISTAVGAGASMTVSSGVTSSACLHSMVVERWSSAALAATPAVNSTRTGSGTAPSATLTTTGTDSVVSSLCGDWNAASPTTRAYRSSATEDGLYDRSAAADTVHYYFYQSAAVAGSQTIGLTAPTQLWSMLGIEIQEAAGGPPPTTTTPVFLRPTQAARLITR